METNPPADDAEIVELHGSPALDTRAAHVILHAWRTPSGRARLIARRLGARGAIRRVDVLLGADERRALILALGGMLAFDDARAAEQAALRALPEHAREYARRALGITAT